MLECYFWRELTAPEDMEGTAMDGKENAGVARREGVKVGGQVVMWELEQLVGEEEMAVVGAGDVAPSDEDTAAAGEPYWA